MKAKITTIITGIVSYITVANHISTTISQLLYYLSRNRSITSIRSSQNNSDKIVSSKMMALSTPFTTITGLCYQSMIKR